MSIGAGSGIMIVPSKFGVRVSAGQADTLSTSTVCNLEEALTCSASLGLVAIPIKSTTNLYAYRKERLGPRERP
jgi:hypothetical protein